MTKKYFQYAASQDKFGSIFKYNNAPLIMPPVDKTYQEFAKECYAKYINMRLEIRDPEMGHEGRLSGVLMKRLLRINGLY